MARNSGIDWTDHTWNPWQGCRKVSPGCLNCYMYRDKKRFGQDPSRIVISTQKTFYAPVQWIEPARVMVCSWSDFFIEEVGEFSRNRAWDIMRVTPHLTYMILTKRAENIAKMLPPFWPLSNVWLGVTCEDQYTADERIPKLLQISAARRFISVEPMLGPVDLLTCKFDDGVYCQQCGGHEHLCSGLLGFLDWVICGGESGPASREMLPEWALSLKNQCAATNTPFFMKQMSGRKPIPDYLQCREFPK